MVFGTIMYGLRFKVQGLKFKVEGFRHKVLAPVTVDEKIAGDERRGRPCTRRRIPAGPKWCDVRLAVPGVDEPVVASLTNEVEKEIPLGHVPPGKAIGETHGRARAVEGDVVVDLSSRRQRLVQKALLPDTGFNLESV